MAKLNFCTPTKIRTRTFGFGDRDATVNTIDVVVSDLARNRHRIVPPQRFELRPDTLEECCTSVIRKGQIKDDEQLYQESRPQTSHTIRELGCYINTIKIEYLSLVCTLTNTSPCPLFYVSYHLLYLRRDSNSHLVVRSHRFYSVELRRYIVCMMGHDPMTSTFTEWHSTN